MDRASVRPARRAARVAQDVAGRQGHLRRTARNPAGRGGCPVVRRGCAGAGRAGLATGCRQRAER
eukprot:10344661-Alexandrium_andersonii.AAC.1